MHLGDVNGDRIGIDFEYIEPLVVTSFKHLIYYSLKHGHLLFVNHPPQKTRNIRVVLRQMFTDKITLNAAAEYHFISLNKFEVTIITALSSEEFRLSDNQFAIEMNDNQSILYRLVNKKIVKIDDFSEF